ncbi:two component transcriptional regulator, LuxR family [Arboricoccus pini]|uniref:Two component transcriptional regulator, LuxR family n=1 Tax=Arboricoccus pini TaxID=1963835 RepID=A0A212R144_9PROT|nr:response regulator transcription factor [Arboricoccus pini]SNB65543.1 two component transcriptional regulator, LuxR family [Arboricoccus pini]
MSSTPLVLIIDDHPIVRGGCRRLLQSADYTNVIEAASGHDGLKQNEDRRPEIIILDLNLPDVGGLELIRRLGEGNPGVKILIFSMYEDPVFAARALQMGAMGYVTKNDDPEVLLDAVEQVRKGVVHLSHIVAQKLALLNLRPKVSPLHDLSPRELDILELLGAGKSLAEIADRLELSYRTIANITSQLRNKVRVSTTGALVKFAIEHGPQRLLRSDGSSS